MAKKAKKKTQPKTRNWIAVAAHFRKGGAFKNKKASANKNACRGKVRS